MPAMQWNGESIMCPKSPDGMYIVVKRKTDIHFVDGQQLVGNLIWDGRDIRLPL